ncbi:hypothetical protein ACK37D_04715 [Aeromonas veronii]
MSLFEKLKFNFHKNYEIYFRPLQGSKELIVIFSPTAKFNLYNHKFNKNALFLADRKLNYYMLNPGRQTKLIRDFVLSSGFSSVVFLGSSKGATGALLWSSIFSSSIDGSCVKVSCFAFSPQTLLYPYNENIIFPSYKKMYDSLDSNQSLKTCLIQYGNIPKIVESSKAFTVVVYSSGHIVDKNEAERIFGERIVHVRIPLSFHGSITPFIIDRKDPDAVKKISKKLFVNAVKDEDLRATLPATTSELCNILDGLHFSSLNNFIEALS